MKKQAVVRRTLGALSVLSALFLLPASASAQVKPLAESMKEMQEKGTIISLHSEVYTMGAQMGAALYYATITETEEKKGAQKNAQLFDDSKKARTLALFNAMKSAQRINSILSESKQTLDTAQFYAFQKPYNEANARTVTYLMHANLGSKLYDIDMSPDGSKYFARLVAKYKLTDINKKLREVYYLGYYAGSAEVNAANGEANRQAVVDGLKSAGESAKQMSVYNAANTTLIDFAQTKVPMKDIHPKVVSLKNWYGQAVESLVRSKLPK